MQQTRSWKDFLRISGIGVMMGAADAIPGVSGGTIAFLTGIYEDLINSLKQFGPELVKILFSKGIKSAWQHVNGTFLLFLFSGIILALATIANVILYLMDNHAVLLWAFFFGLILSGVWSVIRHVEKWSLPLIIGFIGAAVYAYTITTLTPASMEGTPLNLFFAGTIAICAMILPGISGSFILLLLGLYAPMLMAVKELQLVNLALFAVGCVVGLLTFSHVLSWMFSHYKALTLTILGGFMLGALNKVWPWKLTLETIVDRHGEVIPVVEQNVLPAAYEASTGQSGQLLFALALMVVGALLVLAMERLGESAPDNADA